MISFKLWSAGMINQLWSLEIAVSLSALTTDPILVHNFYDPRDFGAMFSPICHKPSRYSHLLDPSRVPKLYELVNWDQDRFALANFDLTNRVSGPEINLEHRFYRHSDEGDSSDFSWLEPLTLEPGRDVRLVRTMFPYSRFFFNRPQAVDAALSKITWRREYATLAREIAADLGSFTGVHLRLTDHSIRTFRIGEADVETGLQQAEQLGRRIVLSTDDPEHPWVKSRAKRFTLLDDVIVNWGRRFEELPLRDAVVFGLICCLVLTHSADFIGTPGSTYSAYIHRRLHQRGISTWRFFSGESVHFDRWSEQMQAHGRSSWTAFPQLPRWWREWPEAKLRPSA